MRVSAAEGTASVGRSRPCLIYFFLLNACLCVCEVSAVRGIPQQDGRLPFLGRSPRPPSQPHVRGSSGAAGPEMDLYSPRDLTRTLPAQPRRLHRDTGPQISPNERLGPLRAPPDGFVSVPAPRPGSSVSLPKSQRSARQEPSGAGSQTVFLYFIKV